MEFARKRSNFTEQDIVDFQDLADDFYESWIELKHLKGINNYFHLVGAGHLAFYLREWGNLFRYSQQGWESMNALIKRVSSTGEHSGAVRVAKKMSSIQRWIQLPVGLNKSYISFQVTTRTAID
jgi:hypothetical protein